MGVNILLIELFKFDFNIIRIIISNNIGNSQFWLVYLNKVKYMIFEHSTPKFVANKVLFFVS